MGNAKDLMAQKRIELFKAYEWAARIYSNKAADAKDAKEEMDDARNRLIECIRQEASGQGTLDLVTSDGEEIAANG